MSYDIIVFDLAKRPKNRDGFMEWVEKLEDEMAESGDSDEVNGSTKKLKEWFFDISKDVIPLTGQYSREDESDYEEGQDDEVGADYFFTKNAVFIMFSCMETETLALKILNSAKKHQLGCFDFDTDILIYPPTETQKD